MSKDAMFAVPAAELERARLLSHAAVQWASRAARANLEAQADDSHSNLGWDDEIGWLLSHPLDGGSRYQLGFSFASASLVWLVDGTVAASLALAATAESAARDWCDEQLEAVGLATTDKAEMPYVLDPVDYAGFAAAGAQDALKVLGAWYAEFQRAFEVLVGEYASMAVVPPTVRCWPHHFDLGTLFALDAGDPETARSIGVGLSPGDGSYAEPYLYCTPWPTPAELPDAPAPLHWHTEGFTSLVLPASRIDVETDLDDVLAKALKTSQRALS